MSDNDENNSASNAGLIDDEIPEPLHVTGAQWIQLRLDESRFQNLRQGRINDRSTEAVPNDDQAAVAALHDFQFSRIRSGAGLPIGAHHPLVLGTNTAPAAGANTARPRPTAPAAECTGNSGSPTTANPSSDARIDACSSTSRTQKLLPHIACIKARASARLFACNGSRTGATTAPAAPLATTASAKPNSGTPSAGPATGPADPVEHESENITLLACSALHASFPANASALMPPYANQPRAAP